MNTSEKVLNFLTGLRSMGYNGQFGICSVSIILFMYEQQDTGLNYTEAFNETYKDLYTRVAIYQAVHRLKKLGLLEVTQVGSYYHKNCKLLKPADKVIELIEEVLNE